MSSQVKDDLKESVPAKVDKLDESSRPESEKDSFADLLDDLIEGNVESTEEVDKRIVGLLNDLLDIPLVPEYLEGKIFGLAVDGVKVALVQVADRLR